MKNLNLLNGREVLVKRGTVVFVDLANEIALIGQDHVEVDPDEYAPLSGVFKTELIN